MDKRTSIEASEALEDESRLAKSVSHKQLDLLRPFSRYFSIFKGRGKDAAEYGKSKYTLIRDVEDSQAGIYDKPLPCFGCGVGWFSFLLGFLLPFMWFYATFLYFGNYYRKDPRERAGLAASAVAALGCSLVFFVMLLIRLF